MSKGRITLTSAQAASAVGKKLINMILDMCHDGQLDIAEVETMDAFLRENANSEIAAVHFLRAITREIVADRMVDPMEAYRLKKAWERVVPKEVRAVVSTHLESIGFPAGEFDYTDAPWKRHPATAAQISYIDSLGGAITPWLTKGEASDLIEQLLERRPPTPRQRLLIRFFDRLDLHSATKEQVSVWIDDLFINSPKHERAWDRFKIETGMSPEETDMARVPIGACRNYGCP
jgi:hypothetical protein